MYVAVDLNNAGPNKSPAAAFPFSIVAEVESLRSRQRKDVVKNGIEVRKFDSGSNGNDEDVRLKAPPDLLHPGVHWRNRIGGCASLKPYRSMVKAPLLQR